ncbi:MAG: DUF1461 domain-containing protein [Candidatus Woesearchaeota archaeon]|jgi:integral membrane protein (TIGR01906 family)
MKKNKSERKFEKKHLIIFPRIVFSLFILMIVFIVPLIFISGSKSFYLNRLNENNCYDMISEKDCKDLALNALNYLKGKETIDSRYSVQEQGHFTDVKKILDFAKAFSLLLLIFVMVYFILFYFLDIKEIFNTLKLAGWMILSSVVLLIVLITMNFSGTFLFFHEMLFPQGNWTFPFDSVIITVFSEQFFVRAALTSFVLSLSFGLLVLGLSFLWCKKNE